MRDDALLLALGDFVGKEISAETLMMQVVEQMSALLDADRATVFLLNNLTNELVSVAAQLPEIDRITVPLDQGVAGYVARTGRVVNVPYCDDDVRFWRAIDDQTGYETKSMLAGPLRNQRDELIGVVEFLNKRGGGLFVERDVALYHQLASQLAALLEQTTLGAGPPHLVQSEAPEVPIGHRINRIVGGSAPMQQIYAMVRRVAPTEASVLLRGESGTGKGVIARAIHHNSARRSGPFVHLDCTTLPEGLMENELFGHEKGAFTGADQTKNGKVDAASGGTLFIDEIGDLPLALQGKLLTLVQDRSYHRVGGAQSLHTDIRIVAATNRNLEELVSKQKFREDLYYRLRVVEIEMPSLRDRGADDISALIDHFVSVASKRHGRPIQRIHPQAKDMLLRHEWPGNVRELENCLEGAVIFSDGVISPSHLALPRKGATLVGLRPVVRDSVPRSEPLIPSGSGFDSATRPPESRHEHAASGRVPSSTAPLGTAPPAISRSVVGAKHPFDGQPTLEDLERRYISHLLEATGGNRSECARILGIGRNTLHRKLKRYGLEG